MEGDAWCTGDRDDLLVLVHRRLATRRSAGGAGGVLHLTGIHISLRQGVRRRSSHRLTRSQHPRLARPLTIDDLRKTLQLINNADIGQCDVAGISCSELVGDLVSGSRVDTGVQRAGLLQFDVRAAGHRHRVLVLILDRVAGRRSAGHFSEVVHPTSIHVSLGQLVGRGRGD